MNNESLASYLSRNATKSATKMAETEEQECIRCKKTKAITAFPLDPRLRSDGTRYRYRYCHDCKRKQRTPESLLRRVCTCCGVEKAYAGFVSKDAQICRVCANSAPIKPNCNPWLLRAW